MTNYENISGLDKAAIIFQVYGESLALSFFTDLPESSIIKIRVRSKELKGVPAELKKTVLEEEIAQPIRPKQTILISMEMLDLPEMDL